jgi:hypothetical protein
LNRRRLLGGALAASLLLVGAYMAAGGGSYEPTAVADPCQPREWRSPEGLEETAQQFALSALDGAACELRVSRETLTLALATDESRAAFAAKYGIAGQQLEDAVRAGVTRAIDDAERAGALAPFVATGLRAVAARLPVDELVALINDAEDLFADPGSFVGRLGAGLGELIP